MDVEFHPGFGFIFECLRIHFCSHLRWQVVENGRSPVHVGTPGQCKTRVNLDGVLLPGVHCAEVKSVRNVLGLAVLDDLLEGSDGCQGSELLDRQISTH